MKIVKTKIVLLLFFFTYGCSPVSKEECLKTKMNNQKIRPLSTASVLANNYFVISDSSNIEYAHDSLYSKAKIVWIDCTHYILIFNEVRVPGVVGVGDTLRVRLVSLDKDTVRYIVTARDKDFEFTGIKSDN